MSNRFLINLFNLQNKHNHEKKFLSSNHLTIDLFVHLITDPNPSSSVSSECHSDISSSPASDNRPENDVSPVSHPDIPFFKYIHVAVTDDQERERINKMVYNIVRLPKMQQVCDELFKLMKDQKVLCTINPDSMLAELRRMGLPDKDTNGFSDKNFAHYYRAPKLA